MITLRSICIVATTLFAISGCVQEEEPLTDVQVNPDGTNPPPAALAIAAPESYNGEATGQLTAANIGQATAVGGTEPYTFSNDAPANGFALGDTIVNWMVQDGAGATVSASQTVSIADTTPPALAEPADMQVESSGNLTIVDIGTATATDLVDNNPVVTNNMPSAGFPMGTTAVQWTATDINGNSALAVQMVTVAAPTAGALVLTAPADITQESTGALTQVALGVATVTGGSPPVTITNDAPGPGFSVGTTIVTWTAQDSNAVTSTATQTVTITAQTVEQCSALVPEFQTTVYEIMDDIDPVRCSGCHTGAAPLVTPNQFAFPTEPPTAEEFDVFRTVARIDSGGTSLILDKARGGAAHTGGDRFPDGNSDPDFVTLSEFVERARNCETGVALAITAPQTYNGEATGQLTAANIGQATAVGGTAPYTFSNDAPANGFALGDTIVNWTVQDGAGASESAPQTVSISDTTPPTLNVPADMQVESSGNLTIVDIGTATATDLVDSNPVINNDMPSAGFPMGTTVVQWTATDVNGNSAFADQMIIVTAPTGGALAITAPANITQQASGALTQVALGVATVTGGSPPVTITNDAPGAGFTVGTTTVTWTAQDAAAVTITATQTVTITAQAAEQCSALVPEFQTTIYGIMDDIDPVRCNGCHTGAAPLVTPNQFAFPTEPPTAEEFDVFRTVARIDSGGTSLVLDKARGGAGHSGGDRFPIGDTDPDFITLSEFVERARNCQTEPVVNNDKVILGSPYEQLYKVVSVLGSRVPTQDEISLVGTASDQAGIDLALDAIIDGLMNEAAFYDRIKEMYNDLLLTNKAADFVGHPADRFEINGFPGRNYFLDNLSGNARGDAHLKANYGLAKAPVELIRYVIENDRPFTEILTADYLMVNPYSAVIYGVDAGDPSFPFSSDNNPNNHDRDDFRPVSGIAQTNGNQDPIAGVVGTHSFLSRYQSTNTNVNRKRSSTVFSYFLGVDIEALSPRDGLDLNNVVGDVPTYEDPQCTACHNVMDPVSGLFTKRSDLGRYSPNRTYEQDRTTNGVPRMVPAGYSMDPADQLPDSERAQPLKWLVQRLAADDRFAEKTVRTVLEGLTGIEATTASTTALINDAKNSFIGSNYDFKLLVKEIVLSDYFRAQNLAASESPSNYSDFGMGRMVTPEELDRRIRAVTGGTYSWRGPNSNGDLRSNHYLMYGGINSDDITVRATTPNSFISGIQKRIANQVACERVAADLYSSGVLFPFVDESNTPDNGGEALIRQNIVHLYRHLLGEDPNTTDASVDDTYALFVDVRALGESSIPSPCRATGGSTDSNGTVLPWMAVVTYLLTDYRFLYD